MKVISETCCAH